jgi:hypothetical protein
MECKMKANKLKHAMVAVAASSLLLLGLLLILNESPETVYADAGGLFVSPSGTGTCSQGDPCDLQTALDLAVSGNTLYMSTGSYTGAGGAVITLTESLVLLGGWNGAPTGAVVRDPRLYPTTLDGEDQQRVVHMSGDITPTLDGFIITGGNYGQGGGIHLLRTTAEVSDNLMQGNRADLGYGGGFYAQISDVIFNRNTVLSNTSDFGAVTFESTGQVTMTNSVVANNTGGVFVRGNATFPFAGALAHNTLVQNDSQGVYVGFRDSGHASLTLKNNLIVSHTVGIYIHEDPTNAVTATHTLLYGNGIDIDGASMANTNAITGAAPRFVNPARSDYHILQGSPAIDAGTPVPWLTTDIDGEPRPMGLGHDIGADEVSSRIFLPLVLRSS